MVRVPVLPAPVLFLATAYFTVLLPVPALAELTVIHETLLLAVHVQVLEDALRDTLPLPPFLENVFETGEMLKVHTGVTVNVAVTVFATFMAVMVHVAF